MNVEFWSVADEVALKALAEREEVLAKFLRIHPVLAKGGFFTTQRLIRHLPPRRQKETT